MTISMQVIEVQGVWVVGSLVLVLLLSLVWGWVFRKVNQAKVVESEHLPKLHLLMRALRWPILVYLWLLVLLHAVYVGTQALSFDYSLWFNKLWALLTLAILLWAAVLFLSEIEAFYIQKLPQKSKHRSFDVSGIRALSRLGQVGALLVFILVAMGVLAVPVSGLITVGGIGGIAVAYAGKDMLSNFLGGIMIYANRQFSIGDWIHSPDRDIEGVVEAMGWRFTSIRRFDGQLLYVPNNIFANALLINASRMSHRRIKQVIGVPYNDVCNIPKIFSDIRNYLEQNEAFDQNMGVQVNLTEFAASSVNFNVVAYVSSIDATDFYRAQDALLLKVAEIAKTESAE